jgi:hypothetical protein
VPFRPGLGFTDRDRALAALELDAGCKIPEALEVVVIADPDDPVVQCSPGRLLVKAPPPDLSNATKYPGYTRLHLRPLPDIDTGGLWASHGGYWTHTQTAAQTIAMAMR